MANLHSAVPVLASAALASAVSASAVQFNWGVNEAGVSVGSIADYDREVPYYQPVMYASDGADPVVLASRFGGHAMGINAGNDIVGIVFQECGIRLDAALWTGGELLVLPDLGEGAVANNIDDAGIIYGHVMLGGEYHAARWVDLVLEMDAAAYSAPGYDSALPLCDLPPVDGEWSGSDNQLVGDDAYSMMTARGGSGLGGDFGVGLIPAPGALAVLGLAGLAGFRRRR